MGLESLPGQRNCRLRQRRAAVQHCLYILNEIPLQPAVHTGKQIFKNKIVDKSAALPFGKTVLLIGKQIVRLPIAEMELLRLRICTTYKSTQTFFFP